MDDLDAYRCAKLLLDEHGGIGASRHAIQRSLELEQAGDEPGHMAWSAILAAIDALSRMERREDDILQ